MITLSFVLFEIYETVVVIFIAVTGAFLLAVAFLGAINLFLGRHSSSLTAPTLPRADLPGSSG